MIFLCPARLGGRVRVHVRPAGSGEKKLTGSKLAGRAIPVEALSKRIRRIGQFELDADSGELRRDGVKTRLAEQPLQILLLLLDHPGEVVTREDLRKRLWPGDTFVDFDMGLNRAVRKLRDALGDSADQPTYIETLPRRGYRLIAKTSDPAVVESTAETAEAPARPRRAWIWFGASAALAAVTLIAVVRFQTSAHQAIHSIAVLPFANLSGDRGQEYFADGMTEALITDLAQLRNVRVISRTSVMPYKGSRKSLPQIARDLNVDGVVEGGVLRSNGKVRVTAQLIHASTDIHLWARTYERNESNIVTLQRELAAAITAALQAELTPEGRARIQSASTVSPEAYELFLRGMTAAGKENTQGFSDAIAYFAKAVEKQPDFAVAYVEMARCYSEFTWSGAVAPLENMPRAKAAVLKALSLDPGLADAHAVMGQILYQYDWDWVRSEQELRRALDLNANDARAHRAYAALLRLTGRVKEAKAESARVRELDPLSARKPGNVVSAAMALRAAKNYDQAITEIRRALQMDPSLPRGHYQLGLTLVEAGKLDEGIAELETAVRLSKENLRFQASVGWAYALAGRKEDARKVLAELRTRSQREYVSPVAMALILVGLNETEPALQLLEQADQQRDFDLVNANTSSAFRPLRSEPRFRELMKRIGLPEASRPGLSDNRDHGSMRHTSPRPASRPLTVM